jgi:hypothetical protein
VVLVNFCSGVSIRPYSRIRSMWRTGRAVVGVCTFVDSTGVLYVFFFLTRVESVAIGAVSLGGETGAPKSVFATGTVCLLLSNEADVDIKNCCQKRNQHL